MAEDQTEKNRKIRDALREHLHSFAREAQKHGVMYSGFAFNFDENFLMHFGNVDLESPEDLISLHFTLSAIQTDLQLKGGTEMGTFDPQSPEPSFSPQSLADKLALEVSMLPSDMVPESTRDIARQYISARMPGKV